MTTDAGLLKEMLSHHQRILNARVALDGLSVGDALGEACAYGHRNARKRILNGSLPPGPWWYTDDTELALAIYDALVEGSGINQDSLANAMALRHHANPDRGYGKMARIILQSVSSGEDWREASRRAFSGGSMGNGAAMRVAPLGAYYSDDLAEVRMQATASAQVTHFHPEGIAGAVAAAIASAVATDRRQDAQVSAARQIRDAVLRFTPGGETRNVLERAFTFSFDTEPAVVAADVGNGSLVISQDTVPFCIWNACRCLGDYQEAFVSTVEVGGDCDTNCAIVGGIVAPFTGTKGIPQLWLERRESLFDTWAEKSNQESDSQILPLRMLTMSGGKP